MSKTREELLSEAKVVLKSPELSPSARFIIEMLEEILKRLPDAPAPEGSYWPVVYETPAEAYTRGAVNEASHIYNRMAEQADVANEPEDQ